MSPARARGVHPAAHDLASQVAAAGQSLLHVASRDQVLAGQLSRLVQAVADEAARSPRFARALAAAVAQDGQTDNGSTERTNTLSTQDPLEVRGDAEPGKEHVERSSARAARSGRRSPGPLDPFAVYADTGESGLRQALATLDLEQLRDLVAEHGMDHDRLAMKWKSPDRVIGRIVERVEAVSSKGFAFRRGAEESPEGGEKTRDASSDLSGRGI